jgi:hypothetical protein
MAPTGRHVCVCASRPGRSTVKTWILSATTSATSSRATSVVSCFSPRRRAAWRSPGTAPPRSSRWASRSTSPTSSSSRSSGSGRRLHLRRPVPRGPGECHLLHRDRRPRPGRDWRRGPAGRRRGALALPHGDREHLRLAAPLAAGERLGRSCACARAQLGSADTQRILRFVCYPPASYRMAMSGVSG